MRCVRILACALFALAVVPRMEAQTHDSSISSSKLDAPVNPVATMSTIKSMPAPAPFSDLTGPLSLLGFAMAGATAKEKRKMNLSRTYLFNGISYGPGRDVPVPDDFPEIDGETGDVIHEEGSKAALNQARNRSFSSPPSTGGVNTGEGGGGGDTVSGKTADELDSMKVGDLETMATDLNIQVDRLDDDGEVEEGEPIKRDYVRALSAARG